MALIRKADKPLVNSAERRSNALAKRTAHSAARADRKGCCGI